MDETIFKHDRIPGGFFPEFVWDLLRITPELSRDQNVININIQKGSHQDPDIITTVG